jgi:hypothetical protein
VREFNIPGRILPAPSVIARALSIPLAVAVVYAPLVKRVCAHLAPFAADEEGKDWPFIRTQVFVLQDQVFGAALGVEAVIRGRAVQVGLLT